MRSCRLVAATAPRPRQPTHPADGASQAFRQLVNGLRPFTPLAVWRWLPRDSVGGARGGPRNTGGQEGLAGSALPAGEAPAPWDDRGQRRVTRRPPSGGKRRRACPSARRRWWLWVLATEQAVAFLLDPHRSAAVLRTYYGWTDDKPLTPALTLVSDALPTYARLALEGCVLQALCWAHCADVRIMPTILLNPLSHQGDDAERSA